MLSKSLWKGYAFKGTLPPKATRPDLQELLDSLAQAIEVLPRRDSRKEPIIEPHYKLISIIHKLVIMGDLDSVTASEHLREASPYARKVPAISTEKDEEGWEEYVLGILKILRNADKSGWHHRMTARAAHIIYEGSSKDIIGALGAKHELTQSIFTKTMILQVWKPEFERPGRHFVYTSRYVRFFAELLDKTTDRPNFESLLRRIRKKAHDFYNHEELWKDMVHVYLKMLRRAAGAAENHEENVFRTVPPEEFDARSSALDKWCHVPGRESKTLEILREAVEIKKINGHFLKPPTIFDDLIGDVYALLYQEVASELVVETIAGTRAGTSTPGEAALKPEQPPPLNLVLLNNLAEKAGDKSDATTTANAPTSRTRTKVLRREVLRKAEAAGAPVAVVATAGQVSSLRQTEKDGKRDGEQSDTSLSAAGGQSTTNGRSKRRRSELSASKDVKMENGKRSRTASIHDDADDESESELSDLELEIDEENKEATIMSRRKSVRNKDAREDEDGGGDEEMEEGEGEDDGGDEGLEGDEGEEAEEGEDGTENEEGDEQEEELEGDEEDVDMEDVKPEAE
jgi:hypothetical protein